LRSAPVGKNLVSIHRSLKFTPAMAAGLTIQHCEVTDIVALDESLAAKSGSRGHHKKQCEDLDTIPAAA
jgi:hypothetical protein